MLRTQKRERKSYQALHADLQAIKHLSPPGFRLDAAVAKFACTVRSDEREAAWAARVERQPASGLLANLIDRVGLRKLVVAAVILFGGVATAGVVGVLTKPSSAPGLATEIARIKDAPADRPNISVTPLPLPVSSLKVASPPTSARRRHASLGATRDGVEQEIAHMVMLRRLVESNPRKALAWADQGHRQFTQGALFEEREALYVLALIKVQGVPAAGPRASAFLRRFPRGSFAARIQNAVER